MSEKYCSFCGKKQEYTFFLVSAMERVNDIQVHICDECIETCREILKKKVEESENKCSQK